MLRNSLERRDVLAAGALVGERYRVIAPLARGGFGAVYVAEQLTTERRVALKVLWPYADDMPIDRILAEARVASGIQSEHIVQVIDGGIDPASSAVFVVMELLVGQTLAALVERRGALPAAEVVEYLRQVAAGLDKVHGHVTRDGVASPIVHRDLKPANVFVSGRDDGSALVKVLDFGTAKVLSRVAQHSRVIRGTPQYMAYEQAAGEPVTPATDIWAFGLIAFFLLTGRSYWRAASEDSSDAHLFAEVLTLPLAPAGQRARELAVRVELPRAFDAWFARCVTRDAKARFPSAGSAARELATSLGITPAPVPAPGRPTETTPAPELVTQDHAALSHTSNHGPTFRVRAGLLLAASVTFALLGALLFFVLRSQGVLGPPRIAVDAGARLPPGAATPPFLALPSEANPATRAAPSAGSGSLPVSGPAPSSSAATRRPPATAAGKKPRASDPRNAAAPPAPGPKANPYEMR